MINYAEDMKTKYAEHQVVNIIKSHENNQPNINSKIKKAAKVAEKLNQSNKNSDTKRRHSTQKAATHFTLPQSYTYHHTGRTALNTRLTRAHFIQLTETDSDPLLQNREDLYS
jgi:cystathionine beta-lyase family protein involved in aluminum resistance